MVGTCQSQDAYATLIYKMNIMLCYVVQNLVRKVSTQVIAKSQWIQSEEQCWFLIDFRGFFH